MTPKAFTEFRVHSYEEAEMSAVPLDPRKNSRERLPLFTLQGKGHRVEQTTSPIQKVISGGQTGADQAGLIAAARFSISTGGWMPHGFETAEGPNPQLAKRYGLQEHRGGYAERTATNVRDSDGTIRIAGTFSSYGEKCTLRCIAEQRKPFIDVNMHSPIEVAEVVDWILAHQIRVLNVAGNVRTKTPKSLAWGIEEYAVDFLCRAFRALGHEEVVNPLSSDS